MMNSIANIVRAVKSKADRTEVQRVVAARYSINESTKPPASQNVIVVGLLRQKII